MTSKKIALRWGEPLTCSAPSAVVHQLSPQAAAAGRRLWSGEEEVLCLTFQLHPRPPYLHPQAVTTLNNVWLGWD